MAVIGLFATGKYIYEHITGTKKVKEEAIETDEAEINTLSSKIQESWRAS